MMGKCNYSFPKMGQRSLEESEGQIDNFPILFHMFGNILRDNYYSTLYLYAGNNFRVGYDCEGPLPFHLRINAGKKTCCI